MFMSNGQHKKQNTKKDNKIDTAVVYLLLSFNYAVAMLLVFCH